MDQVVKTNLSTELPHPRAAELDGLTTLGFLEAMNDADAEVAAAVRRSLPALAPVVAEVARRVASGGRLIYAGAGSGGRLAALDASECPTTFGVPAGLVMVHVVEGGPREDDEDLGRRTVSGVASGDAVIGVSASGSTRYVLGALSAARAAGAYTVAVVGNEGSPLGAAADAAVVTITGPEIVAGSTRLKAGTAQKLVLNMLSTAVFQQLGRLYRGRMVAVVADNRKLWARTARIVQDLAGCDSAAAEEALGAAGGDARVALIMLSAAVPADEARRWLEASGGRLGDALA